jgi:hypothetical protein
VICQIALGPEGLPDWVIFSEKSSKDEAFSSVFSMNHKFQGPRSIWSTYSAMEVGHSRAGVMCSIFKLSLSKENSVPAHLSTCFRHFQQLFKLNSHYYSFKKELMEYP